MTPAQQFARSLQREFRNRSASAAFGEIAQFRALKDAFGALKPKFQVEEYHGAKRQVCFYTTQPWLRPKARCELCDLLLITYSTTGLPQVRLMLLQAKLSRSTHDKLCSYPGLQRLPTEFQSNYEQWDLLSARPRLDPTGVFTPPPDLLRTAVVPSIGAFGVFHRTSSGPIDMFYASADTLRPVGSPTTRYGKLSTTIVPSLRKFNGFPDKPLCCCLLTFAEALFKLHLGTPVVATKVLGAPIRNEPLASFVRGILLSYIRGEGANSILTREVLDLIGDSVDNAPTDDPIPSLVILKGGATDHGA